MKDIILSKRLKKCIFIFIATVLICTFMVVFLYINDKIRLNTDDYHNSKENFLKDLLLFIVIVLVVPTIVNFIFTIIRFSRKKLKMKDIILSKRLKKCIFCFIAIILICAYQFAFSYIGYKILYADGFFNSKESFSKEFLLFIIITLVPVIVGFITSTSDFLWLSIKDQKTSTN